MKIRFLFLCLILLFLGCLGGGAAPRLHGILQIDIDSRSVTIPAEFRSGQYIRDEPETGGHHAIVWQDGGTAAKALFVTPVSDVEFHDALVTIGAVPGDNLSVGAWFLRDLSLSPAADAHAEGTSLAVTVIFPAARDTIPIEHFFEDTADRGLDLRFSGNRAAIPVFRSGCVICLYSCPGGKVANAAATIRDQTLGRTVYRLRDSWRSRPDAAVEIRFTIAGP